MTIQLQATDLCKRFGGVTALDGICLRVDCGEMIGLIGPNGSGKTTLLNVLSGYYAPDAGQAWFQGQRIDGSEPARLAAMGIARSFQVTKIFRRISVMENLLVAGLTDWSQSRAAAEQRAMRILEPLELAELASEQAVHLSGGQAKLLEFARIMMLQPRLVLLDEPFGGVHPNLKRLMHDTLRTWNAQGTTVILISHDMASIFGLCPRILALHNGIVLADGDARTVRNDPGVLSAYLGAHAARKHA